MIDLDTQSYMHLLMYDGDKRSTIWSLTYSSEKLVNGVFTVEAVIIFLHGLFHTTLTQYTQFYRFLWDICIENSCVCFIFPGQVFGAMGYDDLYPIILLLDDEY